MSGKLNRLTSSRNDLPKLCLIHEEIVRNITPHRDSKWLPLGEEVGPLPRQTPVTIEFSTSQVQQMYLRGDKKSGRDISHNDFNYKIKEVNDNQIEIEAKVDKNQLKSYLDSIKSVKSRHRDKVLNSIEKNTRVKIKGVIIKVQ